MAILTPRLREAKIEIDLDGEHGNVFVLISVANNLTKKLGITTNVGEIMRCGTYEDAVRVFDVFFGEYVNIRTRNPERFTLNLGDN
ncbi:hypothetical protein [Vibrio gangliei]|uniref:hypothetical protein n=1 Tax=Vibrio gangliei TaxID=2077090 RepID=UPI000D020A47|nr:hypothetical protein [Vibrio gangliei]